MIWEVKHVPFYPQGPDGLPGPRWHLGRVARNVLDPKETVLCQQRAARHSGGNDPLGRLLAMARRAVLRGRQRRGRPGPLRGATLSGTQTPFDSSCQAISYLFLAITNQRLRGKKSELDRMLKSTPPSPVLIRSWWMSRRVSGTVARAHRVSIQRAQRRNALGATLPHQANSPNFAEHGHQVDSRNSRVNGTRSSAVVLRANSKTARRVVSSAAKTHQFATNHGGSS